MQHVDLSLVSFMATKFTDTFMFADFPKGGDYVLGEPTSDFLGYFGFGSGMYAVERAKAPSWAPEFLCFEFPSYDELLADPDASVPQVIAKHVELVCRVVDWYLVEHKILLDIGIVRKFFRRLGDIFQHQFSDSVFDAIILQYDALTRSHRPRYHVADATVIYGVKTNGDGYIGIGGPSKDRNGNPVEQVPSFNELKDKVIAYHIEDDPRFNWTHSTQLGNRQHMHDILQTMRRHHFTKTVKEQDAMLCNMINKVKLLGGE